MDFLFSCPACHGPLLARRVLRGAHVSCGHCATGLEIRNGQPVTESITAIFLDGPNITSRRVLRRARVTSLSPDLLGSIHPSTFPRTARITRN